MLSKLSFRFKRPAVLLGIFAVMAMPFAVGCDSDSDHDYDHDRPTSTKEDVIRADCPEGQFSSEFVRQSLRRSYFDGYAYGEDSCITHDQVVVTVSDALPRIRRAIDEFNAVLDSNKAAIDEFIKVNYQSVASSRQRLLKQLKDNCGGLIEGPTLVSPVPSEEIDALARENPGGYVSSPLVGDVAQVTKTIEGEYTSLRQGWVVGYITIGDVDTSVYGKRGAVSLRAELQRVYHEAWTKAYEGVKPEFVYDYADAIVQVCGSGTSPTTVINNRPTATYNVTPPPPIKIGQSWEEPR